MIKKLINKQARRIPVTIIYVIGILPFLFYLYLTLTNQLGADPVKTLEKELGERGIQFLIATLAITPLLKIFRINLMKFRRSLGLLSFFYIAFHFIVWTVLDKQFYWPEIIKDIFTRPYLTFGILSLLLIIPLAITSNNKSIRHMGFKNWNYLHMLFYPSIFFGGMHYMLSTKVWEVKPIIYFSFIILLLLTRIPLKEYYKKGLVKTI